MTFGPSQPPTPSSIFINRCTWKSSQYYIVISRMTSFIRISQKLVFHQSKCICAIKRILSTTAMYVSSSSFMYLRISCYCDAYLNSSDLRVGVTTLLNTIQLKNIKRSFVLWRVWSGRLKEMRSIAQPCRMLHHLYFVHVACLHL